MALKSQLSGDTNIANDMVVESDGADLLVFDNVSDYADDDGDAIDSTFINADDEESSDENEE